MKNNGGALIKILISTILIGIISVGLISVYTSSGKWPEYRKATNEEKKDFKLNKTSFEKYRKEYEELKDCYLKSKETEVLTCQGIAIKEYLNKLKLIRINNNQEYIQNQYETKGVFFEKKQEYKLRRHDGYVYSIKQINIDEKDIKINGIGEKYILQEYYKYTLIDSHWLIVEQIKGYQ